MKHYLLTTGIFCIAIGVKYSEWYIWVPALLIGDIFLYLYEKK